MEEEYIIVNCPHCNNPIMIYLKEINCSIFRHGIYKDTNKQIDPHLDKENCDKLLKQDLIYGCSKPFKLIKNNDIYSVEICDYI